MQAERQRRDVRLDAWHPDALKISECGPQLVDRAERERGVLELLRSLVDVVAVIGMRAFDVQRAPPVGLNPVEFLAADVERRHAVAGVQPLVGAAAERVYATGLDVDGHGARDGHLRQAA